MAIISVPNELPPEVIEYLNEALRSNRSVIIGPDPEGKIEVFSIRSKPQEIAAAVAFSAGFEVEDERSFDPAEVVEHEINIELY